MEIALKAMGNGHFRYKLTNFSAMQYARKASDHSCKCSESLDYRDIKISSLYSTFDILIGFRGIVLSCFQKFEFCDEKRCHFITAQFKDKNEPSCKSTRCFLSLKSKFASKICCKIGETGFRGKKTM